MIAGALSSSIDLSKPGLGGYGLIQGAMVEFMAVDTVTGQATNASFLSKITVDSGV